MLRKFDYQRYVEQIRTMPEPIMISEIPKVKLDLRGIRECADWIRKKATFKSNVTGEYMSGFMTVDSPSEQTAYMPINGFTTVDIGCERGNNSYNMAVQPILLREAGGQDDFPAVCSIKTPQ